MNNKDIYIKPVPEQIYLVNRNVLSLFKSTFSYQEFVKIINKNQLKSFNLDDNIINIFKNEEYYKTILSKKNDLYKRNNRDFFNIELNSYLDNKNMILFYPINFNILNKDLCQKLIRILKLNSSDIKLEKMFYIINQGKILLTQSQDSILNQKNINNPYLIYIFSLSFENNLYANYILEVILSFIYSDDLNNNFSRILREEKIEDLFSSNYSNILINKYNCKNYVINKKTQEQLYRNINIFDEPENILNKNLSFIIYLYKEYSTFSQIINELKNNYHNSSVNSNNYNFFLIDANYLKEIESELIFQEVSNILYINSQELNINLIQDYNINNSILEKLKAKLEQNILKHLRDISDEILQNKLSNMKGISPLCVVRDEEKKYYFQNCKIINGQIAELLYQIDRNIKTKIKNIKYIVDKENIIF